MDLSAGTLWLLAGGVVLAGAKCRTLYGCCSNALPHLRNGASLGEMIKKRWVRRSGAPSRCSALLNHDHHPRGAGINRG